MKKLFSVVLMGCLFTACTDNAQKETETTTVSEPAKMSGDSLTRMNADSTKAAADKRAKDSADAAHGHSH